MDEVSVGLTNSCETPFLPGICLSFKNHGENWTELNGEAQRRGADLPSSVFPARRGVWKWPEGHSPADGRTKTVRRKR